MTTFKNQTLKSAAILLLASSTIFYACKKEQAAQNEESASLRESSATISASDKIKNLAAKAQTEADNNDVLKAAFAEYKALSGEELDTYNKLRGQSELAKLNNEQKRISKADFDFKKHRINQITNLRLEVNRLAIERYGKSANQLDAEKSDKVDAILNELMSTKFAGLKNDKTPSEAASVSACENLSFPSSTTIGGETGIDDYAIYRVKSDCDYRFMYSGSKYRLDSDNFDTWAMMEQMDWSTGRYVYSGNTATRIILGYNRVTYMCGGPGGVNLEMLP